jgi:hypothetical protein
VANQILDFKQPDSFTLEPKNVGPSKQIKKKLQLYA